MSGNMKNVRDRLAASLGRNFGERRGSYSLSSAAAVQLKRKLIGVWTVVEHRIGDAAYVDLFVSRTLKDVNLENALYEAVYEFKDSLCIKRVSISGTVATEEGPESYVYRLSMASAWDLEGADQLGIRPELGYQATEFGGRIGAFKELDSQPSTVVTGFRFEGKILILEEGDDKKRLERIE